MIQFWKKTKKRNVFKYSDNKKIYFENIKDDTTNISGMNLLYLLR